MPTNLSLDSNIPSRWLPLVRATWLLLALLLISGFIVGLPLLNQELRQPCSGESCNPYTMTTIEAGLLVEWGLSLDYYAAYMTGNELFLVLVFSIPAFLIFWRKSADWIGVLASMAFLFIGFVVMSEAIRASVREYPALFHLNEILISIGVLLFMMTFYLFPDGRFTPRRLGYVVAVSSVVILLPPFLPSAGPRSASGNLIVTAVGIANVGIGFLSQLYRYRRVSTLLIAALFNPLRRRVQSFIDRRFYRRKYDAAQILAQFAAKARDEVDIDCLANSMLVVVEETLQPERISLWFHREERAINLSSELKI